MKRTLLTAACIASAFCASAQITLTASDLGYVGLQIQQAHDTLPPTGIMPGPSGTGQTWNFGNVSQDFVDTLTFSNPAWTANGADFPSATVCIIDGSGANAYVINTSSGATAVGFAADLLGTGTPVSATNTPPEILMNWPTTFGSDFMQTFVTHAQFYYGQDPGVGFTIDSVRVNSTVTKIDSMNASGSLTTPLGTFNTLRVKEFRRQFDTIDIYVQPFGWQNAAFTQMDSTLNYSWWANSIGYMLMQFNMDIPNDTVSSIVWLKATPTNTGIDELAAGEVPAYPNPASSSISFAAGANAAYISIYDVTGRKLETLDVSSAITMADVSSFAEGAYFYAVYDKAGTLLNRSRFNVVKQ